MMKIFAALQQNKRKLTTSFDRPYPARPKMFCVLSEKCKIEVKTQADQIALILRDWLKIPKRPLSRLCEFKLAPDPIPAPIP
jgi:hypothetical protein